MRADLERFSRFPERPAGPGTLAEQPFEFSFSAELAVRGRIDRLDKTESGANLILDYKTGSVDFSPEQIKRGKHFQALVYALAAEARGEPAAGVLFYDLKKSEVRRGLVRQSQLAHTAKKALTRGHCLTDGQWDELLTQGREHIDALGAALRAGDFRATPSAAACEYCEFGTHCRSRFGWTGGAP
jgi:RecB family exonuclease